MTDMKCLPDELLNKEYYIPGNQGSEVKVQKRLEQIKAIKAQVARSRRK